MIVTGRHFARGLPVRLHCEDASVARVEWLAPPVGLSGRPLPWILPGLVDLQVNGYGGREFSSPELTVDDVLRIAAAVAAQGVTTLLPTVTTNSHATLRHALTTIAAAAQRPEMRRRLPGIHLEGPFLSTEDGPRGAHPRRHCRPPDWAEFEALQEAAEGRIRLVTLAPELPGAVEFIRRAVGRGVVVALGHLAATAEQIGAAVDAGARLSTHLGNGAHAMLPRHHNYIWEQLADDRLWASLIVDGHHLPPAVVQSFVRAKTPGRCVLVSDLSGLAGRPPGRYPTELCDLDILDDGRLVVAGQREMLAGASRPLGAGVVGVVQMAGVPLGEAVAMASTRPAELIGFEPGGPEPCAAADLVLLRTGPDAERYPRTWNVLATLCGGRVVSGALPAESP